MGIGWQQLLIVLILVLVLFGGRGRISALMGDMAKGIKSFRKGLAEEDDDKAENNSTASREAISHETSVETSAEATDKTKV